MTEPLELLFLGSGNGFAPKGRYWSSFLLNGRYLFDCCPVALPHLKKCGVPLEQIDAVFITHFHADHLYGLPFLLFEYGYVTPRDRALTIVGPPGIERRVRMLTETGFPNVFSREIGSQLVFEEAADRRVGEVAGLRYVARAVDHVEDFPCFGYRAEVSGRTVAYSGDTMMCDALVDLAAGADAFVVECSCWDGPCGPHLCPDDLRELRRRLGPTPQFLLTHLDAGERDLGIENTRLAADLATFTF